MQRTVKLDYQPLDNMWQRGLIYDVARRLQTRGVAALAVIVCLIIVASLGINAIVDLKASWDDFRQARTALQADWLLASAFDRVRSRLAHDPAYEGEVWTIPADQLDGRSSAEIKTVITRTADSPGKVMAKVVLKLRANGQTCITLTKVNPVEGVNQRTETPRSSSEVPR